MGRSRRRRLVLLLLLVLLSFPAQAGLVDFYGFDTMLLLLNPVVNLGEIKTDPLDPTLEYFEAERALRFILISASDNWQLFLSGGDFQSGMDRIPLERMEWKLSGGDYRRMPAAGKELAIRSGSVKESWLYTDSLSFRLVLRGDEKPGSYYSTVMLTVVFP
ncbi:MAG TPA: hypothetical protein VIL83_05640 [Capillibacterium sp.]